MAKLERELREGQTQKVKKNSIKPHVGTVNGWKGVEKLRPLTHLGSLLKVRTKFQFLSSILKEDKGRNRIFSKSKKEGNPHISPPS